MGLRSRSRLALAAALLAGGLFGPAAAAGPAPKEAPKDDTAVVPSFAFKDGETMADLRLHALTLGEPVRDAAGTITNAVLLLHGTTGSARQFLDPAYATALFDPGKPLDLRTFYVVIPDGIGAGNSAKPSDGLQTRFPHYGYVDQVQAAHDTLAHLGVTHLRLVLGTSMGGMQAWLWGESDPTAMDALVAIASTPAAITGRNMLWRQMIIDAIEHDPDFAGGTYPKDHPPTAWRRSAMPLFTLMTGNPERLQVLIPDRAAAARALTAIDDKAKAVDADDFLYAFRSSADYDPAPHLHDIVKPMLAINFTDDLLNPPEALDLPDLPNLSHVMLPGGPGSFGHQTLTHPELWGPLLASFVKTVPGWPAVTP